MNWWEWVFSGIGVLAFGLLIDWLRKRPSSGSDAAITAQGAKVSGSPVASGTGITQTISETHHHHYQDKPPEQKVAVDIADRPKANIAFGEVGNICIRESWSAGGLFFQEDGGDIAAVVRFSNDAVMGAKNKEAVVKSVVIYRDGAKELLRVTGCWLEQGAGEVRFRIDDSHKLIIGFIQVGELCVLDKREVFAHRRHGWVTELHRLGEIPKITALVRLTGVSSGDCYFQGAFEVTTNPLSISTMQAT